MSINQGIRKINNKLLFGLILFVTAVLLFGIGKSIAKAKTAEPIKIVYPQNYLAEPVVANVDIEKVGDLFVASKNGKYYYLPTCSGAKKIALKNKITFPDKQSAETAGLKPAKNCKGL